MNLSDKLCSCSYSCSSVRGYDYIFPLTLSLPLRQRLAACLPRGKPCALLLFVCCGVFQLNSGAGFLHRFRFRVTPPRGSRGNGWTHQTHLSSLLSYLAGGRWWFPFPPSNVFAFTPYAKCQQAASWQSFFIWSKWLGGISRCIAPFVHFLHLLSAARCCSGGKLRTRLRLKVQ